MTYQNKVKRASKIYNAIIGLSADQSISIIYKEDTYRILPVKDIELECLIVYGDHFPV